MTNTPTPPTGSNPTPHTGRTATMNYPLKPCPECRAGKHDNCDGATWDDINDRPATCPCTHPPKETTATDTGITYLDSAPSGLIRGSFRQVAAADHVHIRGTDQCIKNRHGDLCLTPAELRERLDAVRALAKAYAITAHATASTSERQWLDVLHILDAPSTTKETNR